MINDDTTHLPDLDAMLERARIEAAASRSSDSAQAHVFRILAETEGFASVAQLLRDGIPWDVIAALAATPTDKRAKAKARLTYVAGDAYLHLTATGWAASGRNAKERAPDFMAAQHAQVPAHVVGFPRREAGDPGRAGRSDLRILRRRHPAVQRRSPGQGLGCATRNPRP